MKLTALFSDIDDFCSQFKIEYSQAQLEDGKKKRDRQGNLHLSEIITILIYFHQTTGFRNFKGYYTVHVRKYLRKAFPKAVSYNRFIELIPKAFLHLCGYLSTRKGEVSGISFVDSTPLKVCHNLRIKAHKVFKDLAQRGKTSTGWFYGFKLHIIINDIGELLGIRITPGNTDDRKPVPEMCEGVFGKLFGDKGYISQKLFKKLFLKGISLITKNKKNMKPRLLSLFDRILLRKRSLIETVNDQLKNISHIEHTRHRSPINAMADVIAGLIAYTWQPVKPTIRLSDADLEIFDILNPEKQFLTF